MGQAIIQTEIKELIPLIQQWCGDNGYRIIFPVNDASSNELTNPDKVVIAKSSLCKVTWDFKNFNNEVALNLSVKISSSINIFCHTVSLLSAFTLAFSVNRIFSSDKVPSATVAVMFALSALLFLIISFLGDILSPRLTKIEHSFWNIIDNQFVIHQITPSEGKINSPRLRFFIELKMGFIVVCLCSSMLGFIGFIASIIILLPLFMMICADIHYDKNQHWNWRMHLLSNMFSWTMTMLFFTAIILGFLLAETIVPRATDLDEQELPARKVLKSGHFRAIHPCNAKTLEDDCYQCFYKIADNDFPPVDDASDVNAKFARMKKVQLRTASTSLMVLSAVILAIYVAGFRPFYSLLKKQKQWVYLFCKHSECQKFYIPYVKDSWKWDIPLGLRCLVILHYLIGGILNILMVIFCFDSMSYLVIGRTLIISKTANLLSWLFSPCKILFGENSGQFIGLVLLIAYSLPFLFLAGTFIRRTLLNVLLVSGVIRNCIYKEKNIRVIPLKKFINSTCSKYKLTKPILLITQSKKVKLTLHQVPLLNRPVIQISQGVLELLTPDELIAAIAHELGHIHQGLWKIRILKLLSSLALFPNYYLTICIDWAKNEIEADRFSVKATGNSESLKNALLKISTAQISFTIARPSHTNLFEKIYTAVKRRLQSVEISINFFFGDTLFGYNHPCLLERIREIESNR